MSRRLSFRLLWPSWISFSSIGSVSAERTAPLPRRSDPSLHRRCRPLGPRRMHAWRSDQVVGFELRQDGIRKIQTSATRELDMKVRA